MKKKSPFYLLLPLILCQNAFSQTKGYYNYSVVNSSFKDEVNNKKIVYCFSPTSVTQKKKKASFYVSYGFVQSLLISTDPNRLSVFNHKDQQLKINAFPNPVTDFLTVSGPFRKSDLLVKVFSLSGSSVFEKQYSGVNESITIPFGGFSKGIYMVCVEGLNEKKFFKIIKE